MVGKDYPLGMEYVRGTWKKALRNTENCPSCYDGSGSPSGEFLGKEECEREIRKAVGKGRYMVREMIGVIQLKKYRAMKQRYDGKENDNSAKYIDLLAKNLENKKP